jgi:hypothetical protein
MEPRRILVIESGGLRLAAAARPDRHLDPREQVAQAPGRSGSAGVARIAVGLLPGLIEAVHRVGRVGIVGNTRRDLERPVGQRVGVLVRVSMVPAAADRRW